MLFCCVDDNDVAIPIPQNPKPRDKEFEEFEE